MKAKKLHRFTTMFTAINKQTLEHSWDSNPNPRPSVNFYAAGTVCYHYTITFLSTNISICQSKLFAVQIAVLADWQVSSLIIYFYSRQFCSLDRGRTCICLPTIKLEKPVAIELLYYLLYDSEEIT